MNYSIKENNKKEATLEIVVSSEEFAKGLDFAFNKNKKGRRKRKAKPSPVALWSMTTSFCY